MTAPEYEIYTGSLLVASPYLSDKNFQARVVMITCQMEDNIFGIVLNHRTDHKLRDLWEDGLKVPTTKNVEIYMGGPVPGPLTVIHRQSQYADISSAGDYYLTINKDSILRLLEDLEEPYKFCVGCASWSQEQLIQELDSGYWYLLSPERINLFTDDSDLWSAAITTSAQVSLAQVVGLPRFPRDPEVN